MTSQERDSLILAHKGMIERGVLPSCLNCLYWQHITKVHLDDNTTQAYHHCSKWKQVPPPEVIVYSCPNWEQDIPF